MDKAKQMQFLFEEGGIADDGMNRDPISGNEVPPGSLAEEVRDDIPAQLSEGEYVVPADVVRYYGVKFFEDLRGEAKEGLGDMERDGRIGGEPIDMEGDDTDLSDEELAELQSIMGMAMGGFVPQQPMQQPDPYQQQATLYQQQPRGFQQGGVVDPSTQVLPDFSRFGAGFSFMGGTQPVAEPLPPQTITLYGPNGEIVTLTLPAQQALYDDLIAQGYSTQPVAITPAQVQQPSDDKDEPTATAGTTGRTSTEDRLAGIDSALSGVDMGDPIAAGRAALDGGSRLSGIAGGVLGALVGGPIGAQLGSNLGKAGQQTNNLAEAAANAEVAAILGYDTTSLNNDINAAINSMGGLSKSYAQRAVDLARSNVVDAITSVDAPVEFALTEDKFVSKEAFNAQMEKTAPTGMTYDPASGSYNRGPGTSAAPTSSPRPTARPDNLGSSSSSSDRDSGGSDTSNVGNWGGDRDGDGVPNAFDFDDGVGWADTNKGGGGSGSSGSTGSSSSGASSGGGGNAKDNAADGKGPPGGGGGGGDGGGGGKIVCTAMNASYGFGSYRQAIWLRYSEKSLTEYHEKGYHKIFLPLVDRAYNRGDNNNKTLRKVLENIARHRTADLRAEMQGKKRDMVGRIYRAVLEPVCYIVGRFSKK